MNKATRRTPNKINTFKKALGRRHGGRIRKEELGVRNVSGMLLMV
jgi:hypothetical protein